MAVQSLRFIIVMSLCCTFSGIAIAEEGAYLEEIVVTAQKREQAYTDVPVSVATIAGEVLEIANTDNFQDLIQVTPSLTYSQSGGMRGDGILIRGVGTTAFQSGVEPTVSTVVDGVVLGRTGSFLTDLVDIERVEVLRGPQGTLFGKNASAGVVNVITRRPTDATEGLLRVSATDDDQQTLEAMISGSLSDGVRGRLTAFAKDFDGYIDNQFNGDTLNGDESRGFRGKLDIDISDEATLLLIADYTEQDRDCCAWTIRNVGSTPQFLPLLAYDTRSLDLGDENDEVLLGSPIFSNMEQAGISAEYTRDMENFTLTSITAYRTWEIDTAQDVDNMAFTEPTYGRLLITANGGITEQDQFSQEFRITTNAWDTYNFTVGLFYWKQDLERYFGREILICGFPGFDPAIPPSTTACVFPITQFGYFDTEVNSTNIAVFGQVDIDLNEDWLMSVGLRYTYDDLEFDFNRPTDPIAFPAVPAFTDSGGDDDTDLSGKLALQWNMDDSTMFYGSYTRGYKSQGFDIIFGMTPSRFDPVAPETSDAFEVGLKAEFWDRRARLGATVFHTTFNDFQGQAFDDTEGAFVLTSAGEVVTQGLEIDLTLKPTGNLLVNGAIAYTDAYYGEFKNGGCWTGQTEAQGCIANALGAQQQDLTDKDVPNSPDIKLTVQARYDIPLNGSVDMFVSGNYRWQDDAVSSSTQRPSLDIDSYGILDLNIGVESDDGTWTATFFAKNLLDESYTNILFENVFDGVDGTAQYLQRDHTRYLGGRFEYRFGL
jgi:iron complex outermembrane receptor protein